MGHNSFFEEQTIQSQIKSRIVIKYLRAWARIVSKRSSKIAYIDLYCGPGQYKDDTESTPVLVLECALKDQDMKRKLVTIFNDKTPEYVTSLRNAIAAIPNIDDLSYGPVVYNEEVGEGVIQILDKMRAVPTLLFLDPWGYKGLSLRLISVVLKNWGCDCIFFFNYNQINRAVSMEAIRKRMDELFGELRASELRTSLTGCVTPQEREQTITVRNIL